MARERITPRQKDVSRMLRDRRKIDKIKFKPLQDPRQGKKLLGK